MSPGGGRLLPSCLQRAGGHDAFTQHSLVAPQAFNLGLDGRDVEAELGNVGCIDALGRAARIGSIEAGKDADLAVWSVETLSELVAQIGPPPLFARFHQGVRA